MAVMGLSDTPGVSQLSYLFHPRYWNKGYASQTAAALVTEYAPATVQQGYALEGKPLERIVATARVDNPASFRILEKVGMQRVGTAEIYGGSAASLRIGCKIGRCPTISKKERSHAKRYEAHQLLPMYTGFNYSPRNRIGKHTTRGKTGYVRYSCKTRKTVCHWDPDPNI